MSQLSGNCFYELEAHLANKEERKKRLARLKSQYLDLASLEESLSEKKDCSENKREAGQKAKNTQTAAVEPLNSETPKKDASSSSTTVKPVKPEDNSRLQREFIELKKLVEQTPALQFLKERISSAEADNVTSSDILGYYRVITGALKNSKPAKETEKQIESKRIIDMELSLSEKEKEAFMYKETLALTNKKLNESELLYEKLKSDFDNYKGRVQQDVKLKSVKITEDIMKKMLPIVDNFERAFTAAKSKNNSASESLLQGLEMILAQFEETLKQFGVTKIDALKKPFDPMYHEALMTEVNKNYPEDTVLEILSNGYIMNGKLLRAAAVKVSK